MAIYYAAKDNPNNNNHLVPICVGHHAKCCTIIILFHPHNCLTSRCYYYPLFVISKMRLTEAKYKAIVSGRAGY